MAMEATSGEAHAISPQMSQPCPDEIERELLGNNDDAGRAEGEAQVTADDVENAFFAGETETGRLPFEEDDDVTVVVSRRFVRLSYENRQTLVRALAMLGIAAVGFVTTGAIKLALARHRTASQATTPEQTVAATAAHRAIAKPGSTGIFVSAALAEAAAPKRVDPAVTAPRPVIQPLETPKPASVTAIAESAKPAPADQCRDALAKKDGAAISRVCGLALATDASLAASILAWARRELDRGNVELAQSWARRAMAADDHLADAYLIVGVAEQQAKHAAAAKAAYRRYLELAPKGKYAREVRSSMEAL